MGRREGCSDFGLIFWIHLAVIVLFFSSPFWISWKIILVGILAFYFQLLVFRGCILTKAEFGETTHNSFFWYYLNKMGFKVSEKSVVVFVDFFIPAILLAVALFLQMFK